MKFDMSAWILTIEINESLNCGSMNVNSVYVF